MSVLSMEIFRKDCRRWFSSKTLSMHGTDRSPTGSQQYCEQKQRPLEFLLDRERRMCHRTSRVSGHDRDQWKRHHQHLAIEDRSEKACQLPAKPVLFVPWQSMRFLSHRGGWECGRNRIKYSASVHLAD